MLRSQIFQPCGHRLLIFIHGGSWRGGRSSQFTVYAEPYVKAGANFVVLDFTNVRDTNGDIFPLVDFFIQRYNRQFKKSVRGISDETRRLLLNHNWPGNVRELKNSIERAMILEEEPLLRPAYLPFSVADSGGLTAFERVSPGESSQQLAGIFLSTIS